jgi:hypothetical protein
MFETKIYSQNNAQKHRVRLMWSFPPFLLLPLLSECQGERTQLKETCNHKQ